jgi:MFS family permease
MVDGLRYLRNHSVLFPLLLLAIAPNAFGASYFALLPAFAADVLRGDAALYGTLLSAGGLGAAIATAVIALMADVRHRGAVVTAGGIAIGLLLIVFSQMTEPATALLAAAGLGIGQATFMTLNSVLVQSNVADSHRGRVMSVLMMIWGFSALGTLSLGALASLIGVPATFAVAGLSIVIAVLAVTARFPQLRQLN